MPRPRACAGPARLGEGTRVCHRRLQDGVENRHRLDRTPPAVCTVARVWPLSGRSCWAAERVIAEPTPHTRCSGVNMCGWSLVGQASASTDCAAGCVGRRWGSCSRHMATSRQVGGSSPVWCFQPSPFAAFTLIQCHSGGSEYTSVTQAHAGTPPAAGAARQHAAGGAEYYSCTRLFAESVKQSNLRMQSVRHSA